MTADWAMKAAREAKDAATGLPIPPELYPIFLYCLESPICYEGNRAMRGVTGNGRNPFEDTKPHEVLFVEKHWAFQRELRDSLKTLPSFNGQVYRGVDFKVSENIYREGAIVTWNQCSSTSSDPRVIKEFLGGKNGKAEGTIFIIHSRRGKSISHLSQYPEEKEVLFMANTQLRVQKPVGAGIKLLLATSLRCDLSNVRIVELVEATLHYWTGDVGPILFPEESAVLAPVFQKISEVEGRQSFSCLCPGLRDAVTGNVLIEWGKFGLCQLPLNSGSSDGTLQALSEKAPEYKTWAVFLHRVDVSTMEEAFVRQQIAKAALTDPLADGNAYGALKAYEVTPHSLGFVEAYVAKFGLSALQGLGLKQGLFTAAAFSFSASKEDIQRARRDVDATYVGTVLRYLCASSVHCARVGILCEALGQHEATEALTSVGTEKVTALHLAARQSDPATWQYLIEHQGAALAASIAIKDAWGYIPFLTLCEEWRLPTALLKVMAQKWPEMLDSTTRKGASAL